MQTIRFNSKGLTKALQQLLSRWKKIHFSLINGSQEPMDIIKCCISSLDMLCKDFMQPLSVATYVWVSPFSFIFSN